MELDDRPFTHETATQLVVADWKIDAEAVVTICRQRLAGASAVRVVVPAWLHGLDWAGDPFASVPCARRQVERISRLCLDAGLRVISAEVGDPDPLNAISDALEHRRDRPDPALRARPPRRRRLPVQRRASRRTPHRHRGTQLHRSVDPEGAPPPSIRSRALRSRPRAAAARGRRSACRVGGPRRAEQRTDG